MAKSTISQIRPKFTVLDASNTAIVTMTDPRPNSWDVEEVATLADLKTIAQLVLNYSVRRCIPPAMVELAIQWPDEPEHDAPTDLAFLKRQAD